MIVLGVNLAGGGMSGYETGDFPEAGDPATGDSSTTLFLNAADVRLVE